MNSSRRLARPLLAMLASALGLFPDLLFSQTGCPGCLTALPQGMTEDTIFLQKIPDGLQKQPYDADISFRMPKSTTPVHAVDSTTPGGFPISKIKVVSVTGLPPGLDWTPSKTTFDTGNGDTDGCFKICGTPLSADTFDILVNLDATIFVVTKSASFKMKMVVQPEVSTNSGFSMTGFESCGPTVVHFMNNVPSGGDPNYTYHWDFGNGYSTGDENPFPQAYSQPGSYPVHFSATIDTGVHKLLTVNVLALSCDDLNFPPVSGKNPDVYVKIKDAAGQTLFNNSDNYILNASTPVHVSINKDLLPGENYTLEVWDDDNGLAGADDNCGTINFTTSSGGGVPITNGNLTVTFDFFHDVNHVETVDTVHVFEIPEKPELAVFPSNSVCLGDTIRLASPHQTGNQWWLDGQKITGATGQFFETTVGGSYHLVFTGAGGCTAASDPISVTIKPLPQVPKFYISQNVLKLLDPAALPASYELHWFRNDTLTADIDFDLCAPWSGHYALEVTDLSTGCSNRFEQDVVTDPTVDCTVSIFEKPAASGRPFDIFPNPTTGLMWLVPKKAGLGPLEIRAFSTSGTAVCEPISGQAEPTSGLAIDLSGLPVGFYFLKIRAEDGRFWVEKAVLRN